ncbi:Polyketide cyclase / dehydrase and lipid transport [Marinobacter daqiaonensis]|uniref:Polyketide cyclase / dehydrase and lipid transport n=1 Tax=Marinobacter daqiaonensis TaxID=650891 RepID=A0A1I6HGR0_9GAMM|nr:SRPBCC family protein [Marinobacter daqiaonensis]SFR53685.1 Polyketide cyclase / dehydrase and lipid transport [Marinobacter daqiaonensis]
MGKTYQSIVIDKPAEQVWEKLRNFHDLSWAPKSIEKAEAVGDTPGDTVGAKRILNDAFHETLRQINDAESELEYSIDDGPSPVSSKEVSNYQGVVRVRPVTESKEGSFVEWYSSWQGNDEDAADFCHDIYASLLRELKKTLEG